MPQISRISAALVLTLLVATAGASAYVLLSPPRTVGAPIQFVVDQQGLASVTDGDGGVSAVVSAIESPAGWNGAGAGILVGAMAGNVSGLGPGDGISTIFFSDPFGVCTGSCIVAKLGPYTTTRPDGSVEATELDIVVNPAYSWTSSNEDPPGVCSGEIYIESVIVHEIGHALGLGHSNVLGATMYPSVASCNNGAASIAQDDADGILALYGAAPCSDCERYEGYLDPGASAIPSGSYFYTSGGTIEAWYSGTQSTSFFLTLYRWNGSSWSVVAATSSAPSGHLAYSGSAGYYYLRITSDPQYKPGRYFFYLKVP